MAAPQGNNNYIKGRRWTDAIDRALAKRSKGDAIKALDKLAETFLSKCDEGDMSALRELGDRMEGKSAQSVIIAGDPDQPLEHKVTHTMDTDAITLLDKIRGA